jgi:nitrogen fixation/metabolism regulation signal transduction histidine kinase
MLTLLNTPGVERALGVSLNVAKSALARIGDETSLEAERLAADPALVEPAGKSARAALDAWASRSPLDFAALYALGSDGRLHPLHTVLSGRLRAVRGRAPVLTDEEIYKALQGEGVTTHADETVAAVRRLGRAQRRPPVAVLVVGARLPDGFFSQVREVSRGTSYYHELELYRRAARRGIWITALFVGGGMIVLVLFAALVLGRVLAQPVQQMTTTMRRIAAGDGNARVPVYGTGEMARLAESLNALAAEVEVQRESASRADRLAAAKAAAEVAAHEIGNAVLPLPFAVRRVERLLEEHSALDPAIERSLRSISAAVESLKELTGRLAAFASQHTFEPGPCSINAVVNLVAEMYAATGGQVRLFLASEAEEIQADRTQLIRALTNLVKNALEACGPRGNVEIRTSRIQSENHMESDTVRIEILDDGPGIPPDRLTRIFQPYTSYKTPRGTGLGLAVTADIVAQHGGTIRAENRSSGGARFVIDLPARRDAPLSVESAMASAPGGGKT